MLRVHFPLSGARSSSASEDTRDRGEIGSAPRANERGQAFPLKVIVLPGSAGPMPWDVHGVVQHTQDVDAIFHLIHHVENEVTRGPAALRDVEEPPVGRQPVSVVAKPGIVAEVLARFGDQRTILRHLQRPELRTGCAENLAYVGFRDIAEEEPHGGLLPERFGFGLVHESLELFIGLELRTVLAKRGKAFLTCAPQGFHAILVCLALFERFLAGEQDLADGGEAAGGDLRFGEAGDLFRNLAGTDGARHGLFPQ